MNGVQDDSGLREELSDRLLAQCSIPSPTGGEAGLADHLEGRYRQRGLPVQRVGDSLVVRRPASGEQPDRPLVLLVGHLDVVPPTDLDRRPHRTWRDGVDVVVGRGASDMKAGNVVAMHAFEEAGPATPCELALVLYAGEEGPAAGNQLRDVLAAVPSLRAADLAVVLEPTDGEVQLGCLGGLHALLRFAGQQAHSARPWHGRNAVTAAGELLADLDTDHVREVVVDGIGYRDVWSVTQAWSEGLGPGSRSPAPGPRNVIPGAFFLNLNFRFAPSRDAAAAEAELRARIGARAEVDIVDVSPPAAPGLDQPLVRRFVEAVGAPVAGKQAWTDVARFAEVGVPALNFGPGLTAQAHQQGEFVPLDALVSASRALARFVAAAGSP